jgi:hypothetical protein
MRDLVTVKEARNNIRNNLVRSTRKRDEISDGKPYKELSEYNQEVYIFLTKAIDIMKIQINSLEFVLNEDTNLNDPYYSRGRKFDICEELVFKSE